MPKTLRPRRVIAIAAIILALIPFAVPSRAVIPVQGASVKDWNPRSFWYEPWGRSGVHKGIDIFSPRGRPVLSATYGVVVFNGTLGLGGNAVAVLGPKWRIHYYAHLERANVQSLMVGPGSKIGSVGTSGNAAGKPPHLHYAVLSLIPRPWQVTGGTQGWKRMFFVDPGAGLVAAQQRVLPDVAAVRSLLQSERSVGRQHSG